METKMTKPIPEGFSSATPSLIFKDAREAIETYKKAFDAKVIDIYNYPDSDKIMHAVIQIGDSKFMFGCETPDMKANMSASFYLYVPNCDTVMKQAKESGMKEIMAVEETFWGDRLGAVQDPYGYQWSIATHTRDLSREEMDKGARDFFAKMKKAA